MEKFFHRPSKPGKFVRVFSESPSLPKFAQRHLDYHYITLSDIHRPSKPGKFVRVFSESPSLPKFAQRHLDYHYIK